MARARECDLSRRATKLTLVAGISSDDACATSVNERTRAMLRVWGFRKQSPACRSQVVSLLGSRGRRVSQLAFSRTSSKLYWPKATPRCMKRSREFHR
jgi:hypothetical protein